MKKGKKKEKTARTVKFVGVWILTTFLLLCCYNAVIPANEENVIVLTGIPTLILLTVPILAGWLSVRKQSQNKPQSNSNYTPTASVGTNAWIRSFGWSPDRVVDGMYKGQGIIQAGGSVCITLPMLKRLLLDRSCVNGFSILSRKPNTTPYFVRSGKYQVEISYRTGGSSIVELNWDLCEMLIQALSGYEVKSSGQIVQTDPVWTSVFDTKRTTLPEIVLESKNPIKTPNPVKGLEPYGQVNSCVPPLPEIVRAPLPSTGDKMLDSAIEIIMETGQVSPSMLQRKLNIGYAQAAKIIDDLEKYGFVGPFQGTVPRTILINRSQYAEWVEKSKEKMDQNREIHALLVTIKLDTEAINKTETVTEFVRYYDEITRSLQKLISMGVNPPEMDELPSMALDRLAEEFQWHLCDAIERAKDHSIQNIKSKYRNSVEFQKKEALHFSHTINMIQGRCSPDTIVFSNDAVNKVFKAAKLAPPNHSPADGSGFSSVAQELQQTDGMEGHDFERWCADLLEKNGFTDVEVTKGSGDQGVDVLAVKDGIRYAFQCKCYSSDLGNTPVQEVHAGKAMYHCQVGVVMTNRHFTAGAKALAEATGVLLWDRDTLEQMLTT